jgi:hypothetical protein
MIRAFAAMTDEDPMLELFRRHPKTVGETYWQHLRFAARTGGAMVAGGGACMIHGVLPFLFVTVGSRTIRRLAHRIDRRQPVEAATALPAAQPRRSA